MSLPPKKVLVLLTSCDKYPDESPTGYYLSEVAHPHDRWVKAGWSVDYCSITGTAQVDPSSVEAATSGGDAVSLALSNDEARMAALAAPLKLGDLLANEETPLTAAYDALYVAGGYGAMWDFPESEEVKTAVKTMHEAGKIVCAVCHGPIALVNVELSDGSKLLAGKECTGFSNEEEAAMGKTEVVAAGSGPGSCEDAMGPAPDDYEGDFKYAGGLFSAASPPFTANVKVAETLITGQNPASATPMATAVLYALDPLLAEFEPPRDALLAERATLVAEIGAKKEEFTIALNAAKQSEAANVGKIEELQLKAVAARDWQFGKLATIDAQLERIANQRQKKADELNAAMAKAEEEE